ncbi:hypothetical protein LIER_42202 [Lithospermum erythrorhizon]|uniref:Bifunctional inhibitor/plant lipid transfer protein/seed storage helical domain-containing protein n=1 Tax=Lithospermum erythrorhizon TaxID=34254 RepID=A0AAV3RPV4_LITER
MASTTTKIATFFYILLPIWALTTTTSSTTHLSPSPSVDCSIVIVNLAECLSFVRAGSTTKKPEGACCNGLKTVLKTNPECICEGFKNSAQFGIDLNVTKALTLPQACKVSAPSITNCGLSLAPGAAPALSPMPSSPSGMAGAPTTSIGGSEVSPAQAPGTSGARALSTSAGSLVLTLVVMASLTLF